MRFLRRKADPGRVPPADPESERCTKTKLDGKQCTFPRHGDSPYCRLHEAKAGDPQ